MSIEICSNYVKNCISFLNEDGLFEENLFMNPELLYDILLTCSINNFKKNGNPDVSEDEIITSIRLTVKKSVGKTLNDLIIKGLVDVSGIDKQGDLIYKLKI
jgi:hypothetical protein